MAWGAPRGGPRPSFGSGCSCPSFEERERARERQRGRERERGGSLLRLKPQLQSAAGRRTMEEQESQALFFSSFFFLSKSARERQEKGRVALELPSLSRFDSFAPRTRARARESARTRSHARVLPKRHRGRRRRSGGRALGLSSVFIDVVDVSVPFLPASLHVGAFGQASRRGGIRAEPWMWRGQRRRTCSAREVEKGTKSGRRKKGDASVRRRRCSLCPLCLALLLPPRLTEFASSRAPGLRCASSLAED